MKTPILYRILLPLDKVFMKFFYKVIYIGKENIPPSGSIILAGNHTSNLDPLLLMSSTNRNIHFLAKIELFKGLKKHFFNKFGIIPVDRSKKNPEAIKKANEYLNNNNVIGIFPEGTINRTNKVILPFKKGAIIMAKETNSKILPFTITGKYRLLKKSITITFGKPYKVSENIEKETKILENKITEMIRSNNERRI